MKKKRTAKPLSKKRTSPPYLFFLIVILIVVGVVMLLLKQDNPRELSYSRGPQVLGISQVSGFVDFFKSLFGKSTTVSSSKIQTTKLPETSSGREVGNAGEYYPYGEIKDETVVEMPLSSKGGVVEAKLSGNVHFYLVYPSNIPEDIAITLTPYYTMPTAKDAIPLSHDLGYGLDIQWEASRHGELPTSMYAVFDLDQGKTIKQIRGNIKEKYFCDPTTSTFNPQACAYVNDIPLAQHTNLQYAVVAPIRTEQLTHLASLEPTIPIGYDNLIVVPLSKETTLIPQKLSKELLADLIKGNGLSTETTIYRTEAITYAIEHNLYTSESIEGILGNYHASNAYENIKLHYQLPKLNTFYNKLKQPNNLTASEKELAEKMSGFTYDYDRDSEDNLKDLHLNVSLQFNDRNAPEHFITGAALIRRLEKEGIDMTVEKTKFVNLLNEDFDYYLEDDPGYAYTMLITAAMLSPKYLAQKGLQYLFNLQVFAQDEENMTAEEIQEEIDKNMRKGRREMNRLCGPDTFAPPSSIERGLKFANLIGDDDGANQCQQKMCSDLDEALKAENLSSPQAEAKNYMLYQKWCDDSAEKDEQWKKRIVIGDKKLRCTTLIKKNLLTFGDNRVFCQEVLDENDGIDGYQEDPEGPRTNLRRTGETAPIDMDPGAGFSP